VIVLRPISAGAAATAFGCLMAAAPLPAGAAFVGYLTAALLIVAGWGRGRRRFGLANTVTLARLVGTVWILALLPCGMCICWPVWSCLRFVHRCRSTRSAG